MKSNAKAHIALFTAQVIYSFSFIVVKILTMGYIPAFGLVTIRALIVAPMFWITGFIFVREKTEKRDLPKLLLLAIFGIAINQMIFVKGLSYTSPISAAIMMITSPILVLIIASVLLKERITMLKTTGIVLGFAGAAVLMLNSGLSGARLDNPFGDMMIFFSASAWGAYLVLVKPLMQKYNTVTILKWVFTFGFFLVLPFGYKEMRAVEWSSFSSTIMLYILFVVVANTYLAYLLNVYALKALSPSTVSAYIYLQPLFTAMIAIYTGQDSVNPVKVFAAVLIFAGVYLAGRNARKTNASIDIS